MMRPPTLLSMLLCAAMHVAFAQSPPAAASGEPQKMRYCDSNCYVLTRSGNHYNATRDKLYDATVIFTQTIIRFTRESVVIELDDRGIQKATLTGRMSSDGNSVVDGKGTWTIGQFKGQGFAFQLSWGEALQAAKSFGELAADAERQRREAMAASKDLPDVMRLCGTACFVLKRDGDLYTGTWEGKTDGKVAGTYQMMRFTRESVVLQQTDGERVIMTGQISPEGNRLIDGKLRWSPNPNAPSVPIELAWGSAIATARIPEASAAQAAALTRPEFANDVRLALQATGQLPEARGRMACDTRANASATEALEIGKAALRALELDRGVCWLDRAVAQGSARAKVLIAVAMEHGWGPHTRDPGAATREYERIARASNDAWAKYFWRRRLSADQGRSVSLEGLLAVDNEILRSPEGDALRPFIEADWRVRCQYESTMDTLFTETPSGPTRDCFRNMTGVVCTTRPAPQPQPKPYKPRDPTLAGVCPGLR
jgi:hypothetical protein